ncbi:MAG: VCBS repeat-containing protein [Nitrospirae bacterium]|nr:VCBS repeat-containing protein [Nitrospirota bacterium]
MKWFIGKIILVSLFVVLLLHSNTAAETVVPERATTPYTFWGGMNIHSMNPIIVPLQLTTYLQNNKVKGLYHDNATFSQAKQSYESAVNEMFTLAATTGISVSRSVSGPFAWNIIEPEKGIYHFEFPDLAVKAAQANGIALVATLYPFATWDHPNSTPATNAPLDFIWWDYITEYPNDLSEYKNFVKAVVDRYNGDGVNDMPGLTQPVMIYEIGNEPESSAFNSAFSDGSKYYAILKATYDAVKEVCPNCKVVNGGALEITASATNKTFWQTFSSLGGLNYLNYLNWHYNMDRQQGGTSQDYVSYDDTITFWKSIESQAGKTLPMLVTEIGTYTGTPQGMPTQSEEYQAAYYVKRFTVGIANGVTTLYADLAEGWNNADGSASVIGSSSMFNASDKTKKHLFVDSLQKMGSLINGYISVSAISTSQYLFTTAAGKRVLIAWGSGGIDAFKGSVKVVDIHGNETSTDASGVSLSDNPVFIVEGSGTNPHPVRDFNGDGKSDILWQNSPTGAVAIWLMDNATIKSYGAAASSLDAAWKLKGVGDFNGDGKSDILWQNSSTGAVAIWLMDNATIKSYGSAASSIDSTWQIKGVGDFNGDGKSDVLWQNSSTGAVALWFMDNATIKSYGSAASSMDAAWQIKAVGDFDGDGKSDILWQNASTGAVAIWLMDNATIKSYGSAASSMDLAWQIKGVGDFDGDGKSDILWQNSSTGAVAIWLMDNATIKSYGSAASSMDAAWQIKAVGDFDGDGKSDILWQNASTGAVVEWLMNGTSLKGASIVSSTVDAAWQIK